MPVQESAWPALYHERDPPIATPLFVAESCSRLEGALLTSVDVSHALTPPAADIAAPDEFTLTPLHVPDHVGVVASATAQEVAAICTLRSTVAFSALCPWDPQLFIFHTVVGRLINIEQVILTDRYFPLIFFSPAHFPLYFVRYLDTVFIFIL